MRTPLTHPCNQCSRCQHGRKLAGILSQVLDDIHGTLHCLDLHSGAGIAARGGHWLCDGGACKHDYDWGGYC